MQIELLCTHCLQKTKQRFSWNLVLAGLPILLLWGVLLLGPTAKTAQAQTGDGATAIFLPIISNGELETSSDFAPTTSTELAGGTVAFDSMVIPAGVTVTVTGPISIVVTGPISVAGALIADCDAITLTGQDAVTILGVVDNRCADTSDEPGGLTIQADGVLQIGDAENAALIESSGDIYTSNDPSLTTWEFDVLPEQRSATLLPPVCAAEASRLWDSTTAESPSEIRFYADGADPDGGPVQFAWDFGDGSAPASGEDIRHSYTVSGTFTVTLTATDNDNQRCTATLGVNIDDGDSIPELPAVQIAPVALVVAAGEEAEIGVAAIDAQDEPLTYTWDFGDGTNATTITGTHTYTTAGRYTVTQTVRDGDGNQRTALTALYVYTPTEETTSAAVPAAVCPPLVPASSILVNQVNVPNPPAAAAGRDGRSRTHLWRGNIIINNGVQIFGQDGGDGQNRNGNGTVRGQAGGDGGGIRFSVRGTLTVCGGVVLQAGDGGIGGNATATGTPGQNVRAYGGDGGRAGSHALFEATGGIDFEQPGVTIDGGYGGDGGEATASGGDGQDRCNTAQDGGNARAYGGEGGVASKQAIARGRVTNTRNATLDGGLAGDGGDATANGGDGGHALNCPGRADGGEAGLAYARAGEGGNAYLTGRWRRYTVAAMAFTAGDGGMATAVGGNGGDGTAVPAAACAATTATGGDGGNSTALGGKGGRGRINGDGESGEATGGNGGAATATGGDCTNCADGGNARATAGDGGNALARVGDPAPAGDVTDATAGNGGEANATGGKGGDCPTCPAGDAGAGGNATATGGDGGNARGTGTKQGGDGGDGDAIGGEGGEGATCCTPPMQGGDGGDGGAATSRAGDAGNPGGMDGGNATSGGDGGDGGDGNGPGNGGSGGDGNGTPIDIMDGLAGAPGELCPVPTPTPTTTPTATPTPDDPVGPTATPTPTVTVTPTVVEEPVITGIDTSASMTETTSSQPITIVVKLLDERGGVVDDPAFVRVELLIRQEDNPSSEQRVTAEYIGDGCYIYVIGFELPGTYIVIPIAVRNDNGDELQGQPIQVFVIQPPPARTMTKPPALPVVWWRRWFG